ncbi:hypothetical protein EON66_02950 [archaeon]|nr:MAG: hypothetical protein EON66_02950 [archaeon]
MRDFGVGGEKGIPLVAHMVHAALPCRRATMLLSLSVCCTVCESLLVDPGHHGMSNHPHRRGQRTKQACEHIRVLCNHQPTECFNARMYTPRAT